MKELFFSFFGLVFLEAIRGHRWNKIYSDYISIIGSCGKIKKLKIKIAHGKFGVGEVCVCLFFTYYLCLKTSEAHNFIFILI